MSDRTDSDYAAAGIRRNVGVAALRRLRTLVDRELAQDEANAKAVPKVLLFLALLILVLACAPWLNQLLVRLFA